MEPLNLREHAPRKPTDVLGGAVFMARTVDKVRATLPGGELGEYKIDGFTTRMFEMLGIDAEDFRSIVALAQSDDDVAQWILRHTSSQARDAWNAWVSAPTIRDRIDRPGWLDRYPVARELSLETPLLDLLDHDDRAAFAERR